jgi:hypothetical protein
MATPNRHGDIELPGSLQNALVVVIPPWLGRTHVSPTALKCSTFPCLAYFYQGLFSIHYVSEDIPKFSLLWPHPSPTIFPVAIFSQALAPCTSCDSYLQMADFGLQVEEINATAARVVSVRRLKKLKKKVRKEERTLRRSNRILARVARERQGNNIADLTQRVDVMEQQLRGLRRDDDEDNDDDDLVELTDVESIDGGPAPAAAAAAAAPPFKWSTVTQEWWRDETIALEERPVDATGSAGVEQESVFVNTSPPTSTGLVFTLSQGWVRPEDVTAESADMPEEAEMR